MAIGTGDRQQHWRHTGGSLHAIDSSKASHIRRFNLKQGLQTLWLG
jgi:hypothetical protein